MAIKLSSTPFDRVEQTTQNITFYVEITGDDDAPGTAAAPLATLQEAFDRLPFLINHSVVINVGSGNFTGALLVSRQCD